MLARHGVRAERARPLARPHRRVDPRLVEEALRGGRELGRERRVRVEHELARLVPAELLVGRRHRRHAVVVGDAVEAEQLRLQRVPALRDVVAAPAPRRPAPRPTRRSPRWPGCGSRSSCRVAAQAVVDRLVGEQRVEDERPRAQPGREPGGDRLGRGAAHLAVGRLQPRQALLRGSRTSVPAGRRGGESTVIADVSSENSRTHAPLAVSDLSERIRSSGSLSRCGR